jgi:hypothetical protein
MKIQLDTDNKTIKLDSDVKLSELIETLEKLLPKGLWKNFTLETNVTINNWSNPIVIERKTVPYYPPGIWYHCDGNKTITPYKDQITCDVNNKTFALSSGIHNLEC